MMPELEEMLFKKTLAMVRINAECGENPVGIELEERKKRSHEWFEAYYKLIKDAGLKDKYHAYAREQAAKAREG